MASPDFENYQTLADGLSNLLYSRITAATPIEVLSTHDNKLLQVVETADGEKFVTRSYTPEAVNEIEYNYGLDFERAWEKMQEAFADVDLEIVPSRLIKTEGEYPFIIVSEYLEDARPLSAAPTETKVAVATGLGKLLGTSGRYMPAPAMIRHDMFMVVERNGEAKALLTDVDPLVTTARRMQMSDQNSAYFIDKLAEFAWDRWCSQDERIPVATAMVRGLGDFALDGFDWNSSTSRAFMDLHMMSNGLDHRGAWAPN